MAIREIKVLGANAKSTGAGTYSIDLYGASTTLDIPAIGDYLCDAVGKIYEIVDSPFALAGKRTLNLIAVFDHSTPTANANVVCVNPTDTFKLVMPGASNTSASAKINLTTFNHRRLANCGFAGSFATTEERDEKLPGPKLDAVVMVANTLYRYTGLEWVIAMDSSGGSPTGSHADLLGREVAGQHPIGAILELTEALAAKADLEHDHGSQYDPAGTAAGAVTVHMTTVNHGLMHQHPNMDDLTNLSNLLALRSLATHTHTELHTHANSALLALLSSAGPSTSYLGHDGQYHALPAVPVHGGLLGRSDADSHPISAITNLQTALDDKATDGDIDTAVAAHAAAAAVHAIAGVAGLTTALAGKEALGTAAASMSSHVTTYNHAQLHGHSNSTALSNVVTGGSATKVLTQAGTYVEVGTAVGAHASIPLRDAADSHPQAAITGLVSALSAKSDTGHAHTGTYEPAGAAASAVTAHNSAFSHALLHSHSNSTVLAAILSSGDGTKYLADDGQYKTVTSGTSVHNSTTGRDAADAHPQSAITGLVTAFAAKAAATHTHAQADVTNLVTVLADKETAGTAATLVSAHESTYAHSQLHAHSNGTALSKVVDSGVASKVLAQDGTYVDLPSAGTMSHAALQDRDSTESHPQAAITGLVSALSGKEAAGTAASAVSAHAGGTGVHSLSSITGLVTNGDGSQYLSNDGTYKTVTGGEGESGDFLSVLKYTPTTISTPTSLSSAAFGHMYYAGADVTLPSPTGNQGKHIGFVVAAGVTINRYGTETINGDQANRTYETVCMLFAHCTGSAWFFMESAPATGVVEGDTDMAIFEAVVGLSRLSANSFSGTGLSTSLQEGWLLRYAVGTEAPADAADWKYGLVRYRTDTTAYIVGEAIPEGAGDLFVQRDYQERSLVPMQSVIPGVWARTASEDDMLARSGLPRTWLRARGRLIGAIGLYVPNNKNDSGAVQPTLNLKVNGTDLLSSNKTVDELAAATLGLKDLATTTDTCTGLPLSYGSQITMVCRSVGSSATDSTCTPSMDLQYTLLCVRF